MIEKTDILKSGVEAAFKAAGSGAALARLVGVSRVSVYAWDKIPAERVVKIEELTGVPRETLRPDLYRGPGPVETATEAAE